MATALADLEKLAVWSQRAALAHQNNFQKSFSFGICGLRGSWNFPGSAQRLALRITGLENGQSRRQTNIRAKKNAGRSEGPKGNIRPDLKFDSTDIMEMEFGRLLGEDRQTTLAKVIGKKINPDTTYVKIEKEKELKEQKESSRRSSPPLKVPASARPDFSLKERASDYTRQALEPGVPDLVSPPVRPPGFEKANASPGRAIRVVAPAVRSAGGKKDDLDASEFEGLVRKPLRVSETEKGLPPARPEKTVVAPMLMRRNEPAPVDTHPKPIDSLLRRPATVRLNALGEPLTSDRITTSVSAEEVESGGGVGSDDLSEERFRQLLEGKPGGAKGKQSIDSKSSVRKRASPPLRPVLPNLEQKPFVLEKPQLVDTSKSCTNESADVASSAESQDSPPFEIVEPQKPPSKLSSTDEAILSKPPVLKKQNRPRVPSVNEVRFEEEKGNTVEDVKTDSVVDLKEKPTKVRTAESNSDDSSGEDSQDYCEDVVKSVADLSLEREDTLPDNVDVQGCMTEEDSPKVVARKPVLRLQKASLPPEQPGLPQDSGSSVESTSQESFSDTDIATVTPNSVTQKQEEGLKVAEESTKEEQQAHSVSAESKLPKTRQPAPGLTLSKPASPAAFTGRKDEQAEAALNNLQKAVISFDERRIIHNKKEDEEDWARAEALRESKAIEELEIIGTGKGGLLVGFGSLVGYLPAFELKAERRPVSFNSWAKFNGAKTEDSEDEENQNNGGLTRTSAESTTSVVSQDTDVLMDTLEKRDSRPLDPELLEKFKKERAATLSLLVGQKAKVIVTSVDKTLRQLRFSEKQAEGEGQELSQRKITLMESLNVGDVVTCEVKKITTFGAFVDLQGVPALIHSSELSWNRNIDPLSVLQVGQEVKVKVCKLDRFLQRINLSLKLMQPDPLLETLESLVSSEGADLIGTAAVVESQVEENEELIRFVRKLETVPEIAAVSTGRRVRGAALAPAFQIYLSGPLDRGYKLLARFGNEVQEVLILEVAFFQYVANLIETLEGRCNWKCESYKAWIIEEMEIY
ncbi:hypothetical protein R1flu_011318 [Riccia fluitans]|uniref:S1 motif domain-containing protein n=1 Tax=Riccia fluitans TaxID=41844 RepID=A0ABD1Z7G1_9MARC